MSYTTIYKVPEKGEIENYAEFKNAWRGALNVWTEMAKRYLGMEMLPMFREGGMRPVWDLSEDPEIPENDRIVMASTFDNVMVEREDLPRLVEAYRDFATRFEPGSLLEQAEVLEKLAADPTCFAVCWNQTSVNSDTWMKPEGDPDIEDDYRLRMYDISKDNGHWFLFEDEAAEG